MGAASRGKRARKQEAGGGSGPLSPAGTAAPPARIQPRSGADVLSPGISSAGPEPQAPVASQAPDAWYVEEGQRAQRLLAAGDVGAATGIFESVLARLGATPSYARAVVLGQLGRCLHLGGRPEFAVARLREALEIAGGLSPTAAVGSLRGSLLSELGNALRAGGQAGEARQAYKAALGVSEAAGDDRARGVDVSHLAALELDEGRLQEARRHYAHALLLFKQAGEPALEALTWHRLGMLLQHAGDPAEAARHYCEAARIREASGDLCAAAQTWTVLADVALQAGDGRAAEGWIRRCIEARLKLRDLVPLGRDLARLAALLLSQPGRASQARQLAVQALTVARQVDPAGAQVWQLHGLLADIEEAQAAAAGASTTDAQRAALLARADAHRQLQRQAPRILDALVRFDDTPSFGRAAILGALGRCFAAAGDPDLAAAHLHEALDIARTLDDSDETSGLRDSLRTQLAEVLQALGRHAEADEMLQAGMAAAPAAPARVRPPPDAAPSPAFQITVFEDVTVEYAFEPDLLLDGRQDRRIIRLDETSEMLPDEVCPMLVPGSRSIVDDDGAARFFLPPAEPELERQAGCIVMRRRRCEVAVAGSSSLLWKLVRAMDGTSTTAAIVGSLAPDGGETAARLLAALAAAGVVDVSGRPFGRFLHAATKKGVLPGGRLQNEDVLRLATDGNYRRYDDAPRIALSPSVPDRLQAFHALTRARRSRREYLARPVAREDFDALLHTACGVTGAMPWSGREVKLRAYPSSGALYAVEIYPIVLRVDGLEPGVYHFRAMENALEMVNPRVDLARIVAASLPVEREMVAGAAAMVCLAGNFARHEQKYGEGGYRMMVAEAGHVSQTLVLAATALRLAARPFGGVFDDLVNQDLGLDPQREQFLLAVLLGHAAGCD